MKEENFDRRAFLASSLGAGAALGAAATTDLALNSINWPETLPGLSDLQTPEDKIAESNTVFDSQSAWRERAALPVKGHEHLNRAEYAAEFFADTKTVLPQIRARHSNTALIQKWFDTFVEIPDSIRENLSKIVAGQIAQESKFDNNAYNPSSHALSMWQVVPDVYRVEANVDASDMASMEVATQVAFYNYERIYTVLTKGVKLGKIDVKGLDFEAFKNHFGLSSGQWENFLTLVMVNAYNTGERRMLEILHWFKAEYDREDWAKLEDQTELGLFSLMADSARANRTRFKRYDKHSSEYVFKSLGAQESLDGAGLDYSQSGSSIVDATQEWVGDRLYDTGIPVATGVASGLVAKNALATSERYPKPKKKVKSFAKRAGRDLARHSKTALERSTAAVKATINGEAAAPKRRAVPELTMSRRQVLAQAGVLTAASITGVVGARNADLIGSLGSGVSDLLSLEPNLNGSYSAAEVPAELARLNDRGIFLSSSTQGFAENGLVDGSGRTALVTMRKDVWAAVEQLLEDLDLLDKTTNQDDSEAMIITGLAENAGHSPRIHGHGPGYAVDFRRHSAEQIEAGLIEDTTVENAFTRSLHAEHALLKSGLVVGEKIFRFNSKYFLFGVKHAGRNYVCYFDAESSHRHLELIPWKDYNVESQEAFVKAAELPRSMKGIWRDQVRDHIKDNLAESETLNQAWHKDVRDYLRQFID